MKTFIKASQSQKAQKKNDKSNSSNLFRVGPIQEKSVYIQMLQEGNFHINEINGQSSNTKANLKKKEIISIRK